MAEFSGSSEWNEQMLFAQTFFSITERCRLAQMEKNPFLWKNCLDAKFLLVMGITNDEGKNKINLIRKEINTYAYGIANSGKGLEERKGKLFDALFYAEVVTDTIANKHMPFLKLKKKVDIGGL